MKLWILVVGMFLWACSGASAPDAQRQDSVDSAGASASGVPTDAAAGAPAVAIASAPEGGAGGSGASLAAVSGEAGMTDAGAAGDAPIPPKRDLPVIAAILLGQSNMVGRSTDSVPAGIPTASIPYWLGNAGAFGELRVAPDGTFGPELSAALQLQSAGYDVAILKVARGNTFITEWLPGTQGGVAIATQVSKFTSAVTGRFPGRVISWHLLWGQGGNEAVFGEPEAITHYAEHFRVIGDAVRAACDCQTIEHVSLTNSDTPNAPYVQQVREQQEATGALLVEETGVSMRPDGHFTGAGEVSYGERFAENVLANELTAGWQ